MSFSASTSPRIATPTPKKMDLLKSQVEDKLTSLNDQIESCKVKLTSLNDQFESLHKFYKSSYGEEFKFDGKPHFQAQQIQNIAQMAYAAISSATTPSNMSPMMGTSPSPASMYYYPQEYYQAQAQAQYFYHAQLSAQAQASALASSKEQVSSQDEQDKANASPQLLESTTESKPEPTTESKPEPAPDSKPEPAPSDFVKKNYAEAVSSSASVTSLTVTSTANEEKVYLDKIFAFVKDNGQVFIADLGQSANGLQKPESCGKLKTLLSSDARFVIDNDKVSINDENKFVYTGTVYAKPPNGNHLFMSFEAEKNAEHKQLFKDQCAWLKDQKKNGFKSESVSAFKIVNGVKFGQNLIAYRNMSDQSVFDSLKINEQVQFYVQKDGLKSSAVGLIRA
jgi:hypothetical protein